MGKFTQKWYGKKWVKIPIYLTGLQDEQDARKKGSLKASRGADEPKTSGNKLNLRRSFCLRLICFFVFPYALCSMPYANTP
jgi:hypothetical protein